MRKKRTGLLALVLFASFMLFTGCAQQPVKTDYSYEELEEVQQQIQLFRESNGDDIAVNIKDVWIDNENNTVVVELRVVDKNIIRVFKEIICDSDAVVFEQGYSNSVATDH